MSAVDVPPGIALASLPAGEFAARPAARRLAARVFAYVVILGVLTLILAARRFYIPLVEILVVATLTCISIAALGLAVRSARLRVDADGVRWGWPLAGFRMHRERMRSVATYRDAIALTPARGSTWYVSSRDWDRFEAMPLALRAAGIRFSSMDSPAPLQARLQSYGVVLDALLLADSLAITVALAIALVLPG